MLRPYGCGIVNKQIIAIRLAGEKTVDSLRLEPAGLQGFALHFVEAGIELFFQLFPFFTVGVLGTPRETIEFVDVEILEDALQRHLFDQLLPKFFRKFDRSRNNVAALSRMYRSPVRV